MVAKMPQQRRWDCAGYASRNLCYDVTLSFCGLRRISPSRLAYAAYQGPSTSSDGPLQLAQVHALIIESFKMVPDIAFMLLAWSIVRRVVMGWRSFPFLYR